MIKKKYVLKLTRRGVTGLILIILMGALWMFVLGIFVGRSSIPVRSDFTDIKKVLASLKHRNEEKIKATGEHVVSDKKKGLGFYEDLKKIKKDERANTKRSEHKGEEDTLTITKNNKTANVKGVDDKENFTIQVASVKDEKTADKMVAELKDYGYPAYKTTVDIPELGRWFRIRVGHYRSREEASSIIEGLRKRTFKPILLQE